MDVPPAVRLWLVLALAAVAVQQGLTRYTSPGLVPYVFWGGLSLFLLFRVYRGGELARIIAFGFSAFGAILYVIQVADGLRPIALAVAYGAEAAVMLAPPVRAWTKAHRTRGAQPDDT